MSNRLQFVHCDTLFKTRDEAIKYVVDSHTGIRPSLYAEPMILKYGDEITPNIILAIGSVGNGTENRNNQTFFIDFAKIEESIKDINETISKNEVNISNIQAVLNSVISSIGLTENGDGVIFDNQIINKSDNIIKALNTLSDYVSNLEKRYNLTTDNSKTISHELTKTDDGINLVSNVNLHENIIVGGKEYENIIIEKDNGLFSYVNTEYNKETKKLSVYINDTVQTFELDKNINLQSGLYDKNDDEIILTLTDGNTVSIDTSELINTIESNNVNKPIELTIESNGSKRTISADVNISDDQHALFNILRKDELDNSLRVDGTAENIMYHIGGDISNKDSYESVQETITKLSNTIQEEIQRAEGIEGGLETRLAAVEGDYLKGSDKTGLENQITAAQTASKVTIDGSGGTGDILKTYTFKQGGELIGTINLAKELVVTGGQIIEKEVEGEYVKVLQLFIANQDTPIEIKVSDLVDVYTGSSYIDINSENNISVKFDVLDSALSAESSKVGNAIKVNSDAIKAEGTRAKGVEGVLETRLKAVEDDYLKNVDKEELSAEIDSVNEAIQNKNVTAEGENGDNALVTARAEANKVTVDSTAKLQNAVIKAETALQQSDKIELTGLITTEERRALGIEGGLENRLKAVEDDYLKSSDKIELSGEINKVNEAIQNKNVSAEGESNTNALVMASADANKVIITSTKKLQDAVAKAETSLQPSDKTYLTDLITNEANRADSVENSLDKRIGLIEVDYLKGADKENLNLSITNNTKAIEKLNGGIDVEGSVKYSVNNLRTEINSEIDSLNEKVDKASDGLTELKPFTVDNTGTDITLTNTLVDGKNVLSASVNISNREKNILKKDGLNDSYLLYVDGTADNIQLADGRTVEQAIQRIDDIRKVFKEEKDAIAYVNDELDYATPGLVVTVIDDDDELKNSAYFVKSVSKKNEGVVGEIERLAKVSELEKNTESINETINNTKTELSQRIDTEVNTINTKITNEVNTINNNINNVKSELQNSISTNISEVNQTISDTEKSLNDRVDSEVNTLNGEITNVNATIGTIQTNISGINTDIEGINTDINGINSNIEDINSNINSINETLSNGQIEIDCGEY